MSYSFIIKISFFLSLIFFYSCQDSITSLKDKNIEVIENSNSKFEKEEIFDLSISDVYEDNKIDIYTYQSSSYNFLDKDIKDLKINNYENKYNFNIPINLIYYENSIYSLNLKGELLRFDINTGKLIDRFLIHSDQEKQEPVSFSLYNNDFVVAYKSGEVVKINKLGEVVWKFYNNEILNTPIKIFNEYLIVLYSNRIIFLEASTGNNIFEKIFDSEKIIQSSGGKILNYYNILFFILSNSEFNSLDTFLFEQHDINFDEIELNTTINNLKDQIHIYKNFLVYLDNGNIFHTYDINTNKFILTNYKINNSTSEILINNALISKNKKFIEIYNIDNGNLFSKIDISKILKDKSVLINALIINEKLHLFTDNGEVIIFDKNLSIEEKVNLKHKKINKIYSYQNKIFISTEKGITSIY